MIAQRIDAVAEKLRQKPGRSIALWHFFNLRMIRQDWMHSKIKETLRGY